MKVKKIVDMELLNRVAMWGLILGVVMSCSRIFEIKTLISGGVKEYLLMTVEWFVSMLIYLYILFVANRQRAQEIPSEIGYRFGQSLNYSMIISIFAAVIVGITSHIYIANVVGGYDIYAEQSYKAIAMIVEESGADSADIAQILEQNMSSVDEIGKNPPTLFSWIMSSVTSYILSSLVLGVIVAMITRRKAKIEESNE